MTRFFVMCLAALFVAIMPIVPAGAQAQKASCSKKEAFAVAVFGAAMFSDLPIHRARELGYFEDECLNVSPVVVSQVIVQVTSLVDNQIQAATGHGAAWSCRLNYDDACVVVGALTQGTSYYVIGRVETPNDLRGMIVAVNSCDKGDVLAANVVRAWVSEREQARLKQEASEGKKGLPLLQDYCGAPSEVAKKLGLSVEEVLKLGYVLVPAGGSGARRTALENRTHGANATVLVAPTAFPFVPKGVDNTTYRILASPGGLLQIPETVLVVSRKWLGVPNNKKIVAAFMRAHGRAVARLTDPGYASETKEFFARTFKISDPDELSHLLGLAKNLWSRDGIIPPQFLERLGQLMTGNREVSAQGMYDFSLK